MKKVIVPGDNVSFKTSKYENEAIINWLNSQSNVTDSIRYLIEQDIAQFGVRNLQEYIPSRRSAAPARIAPAEMPVASRPIMQRPERIERTESPPIEEKQERPSIQQPSRVEPEKAIQQEQPHRQEQPERKEHKDPEKPDESITQEDINSWENI